MKEMPVAVPDNALCLGCGYSLRGLADDVCPECGRAFDPGDRSTFKVRRGALTWRWLAQPPNVWHLIWMAALTIYCFEGLSRPGCERVAAGIWLLLALLPALDYVIRLAATLADRERAARDRGFRPPKRRWRWAVTPLCIVLLSVGSRTDWTMRVRFQMSRPGMERRARQILTDPTATTDITWLGLYPISEVHVAGNREAVFFVTGRFKYGEGYLYHAGDPEPSSRARLAPGWFKGAYTPRGTILVDSDEWF